MSLTLAQLRAVDAVAREGQISRAAQRLGVSQPSITAQIQAFETQWKLRFFLRDGYSITVHPDAQPHLGRIRLLLDLLGELEHDLDAHAEREAQVLHLGFSAHRLIMPALSRFVAEHPAIRVTTQGAPTFELMEAVKRGDLHLASVSLAEAPAGYHAVEIARRPLVVYGGRNHPLMARERIEVADLDGLPMVLWNEGSGTRRQFTVLCAAHGVTPRVALAVNTLDVAYAAVAAGMGLGVAIQGEVAEDAAIRALPIASPLAQIGQFLLCLKGAEQRFQVETFLSIARDVEIS